MGEWNPKFKVMSRYMLEDYLMKPEKVNTIVISITDPDAPIAGDDCHEPYIHFLRLQFNDCEQSDEWSIAMTPTQGKFVADFVKQHENWAGLIIVQCEAGCSRSSGVCAAIMKFVTNDDMPIFTNLRYSPNMNCYRMTLNAIMGECNEEELQAKMKISNDIYFSGDNWDEFGGKVL